MTASGKLSKALAAAFPHTLPVLAGFSFLGFAYGIYMNVSGFSFLYPLLMGIAIFGGSLQFVCVSMLLSPFAPLQTLCVALLVQARHIFYGIAMLEKYKGLGLKRFYMIYALCDETFSINYIAKVPEGVDRGWFMFFVALLDQLYWLIGSTAGGLMGSLLTFNTQGLDFVMTAMFVVIFLEQWLKDKKHSSALIGLGVSVLSLVIFGKDSFLMPAMIGILLLLTLFKKPISRQIEFDEFGDLQNNAENAGQDQNIEKEGSK